MGVVLILFEWTNLIAGPVVLILDINYKEYPAKSRQQIDITGLM